MDINALTKLEHGKHLDRTHYPHFVETHNQLVDFMANMKGDQDVDAESGCITVDKSNPSHPIIRFDNSKLESAEAEEINTDTSLTEKLSAEVINQKSIDIKNAENGQAYLQLHEFNSSTNDISPDKSTLKMYDFVVRGGCRDQYGNKLDGDEANAEIKYCQFPYPTLDSEAKKLSSLSYDSSGNIQLNGFNNLSANVDARIMTLGGLDAKRSGKVGKLIDSNGNKLDNIDIVVRDKTDKKLKYMNLSVDETLVDSYQPGRGGVAPQSIQYTLDYFDNECLSLRNFCTMPNTSLSINLNDTDSAVSGVYNFTDENTWVLTKTFKSNGAMELGYAHLNLSADLSKMSVSCDTESSKTTQKSIEHSTDGYIQLHNFDSANPETVSCNVNSLSGAFDLLDANDSFLVKSGNELKYKKVHLLTNISGGQGQSTSGYSGIQFQVTNLKWNSETYKIEVWGKDYTYSNGLLTNVSDEYRSDSGIETTPWTQEIN